MILIKIISAEVLDEDHYGLKDIKERILEFISVGALTGNVQVRIGQYFSKQFSNATCRVKFYASLALLVPVKRGKSHISLFGNT